jgi:hypothetical protein
MGVMDDGPQQFGTEMNHSQSGLSATAPHAIEVNIEELVLHGFEPQGRFAIAEAIRRDLTELLNDGGFPSAWLSSGDIAHLDCGMFGVPPAFRPESIGRQVAWVVYQRWLATDAEKTV